MEGDVNLMSASTVQLCPRFPEAMESVEGNAFHTVRFMPYNFHFSDVLCKMRLVEQEDPASVVGLQRHLSLKDWFRSKINSFVRKM